MRKKMAKLKLFQPVQLIRQNFHETGAGDNRDLKHQDGRWRQGRHIRVKAEARPASRFTRLSMLRGNLSTDDGDAMDDA